MYYEKVILMTESRVAATVRFEQFPLSSVTFSFFMGKNVSSVIFYVVKRFERDNLNL